MPAIVTLRKFDMSSITPGEVIIAIGRRACGKTFLVKDFLWHKRRIPDGIMLSESEASSSQWSSTIPPLFIHDGDDLDVVGKIIQRQKTKNKQGLMQETFIILEDMAAAKNRINRSEAFGRVFRNGRHSLLTVVFVAQYLKDIGPDLRQQARLIFLFTDTSPLNQKKLYDEFGGSFVNFKAFADALMYYGKDKGCLVINRTTDSDRIEDCVQWYRAKKHPPFKVGGSTFWKYHKKNYRPEDESGSEMHDTKSGVIFRKSTRTI